MRRIANKIVSAIVVAIGFAALPVWAGPPAAPAARWRLIGAGPTVNPGFMFIEDTSKGGPIYRCDGAGCVVDGALCITRIYPEQPIRWAGEATESLARETDQSYLARFLQIGNDIARVDSSFDYYVPMLFRRNTATLPPELTGTGDRQIVFSGISYPESQRRETYPIAVWLADNRLYRVVCSSSERTLEEQKQSLLDFIHGN